MNSNLNSIEKWWFKKKRQRFINLFRKNMCEYENNLGKAVNQIKQKITC